MVGAVPLGLQAILWLSGHGDSSPAGMSLALGIAVSILLFLTWALPGRLSQAVGKAIHSFRETTVRVASDDFCARAEVLGPGPELADLGEELNALIEDRHKEILGLRLEGKQAVALRESSRHLIEECIYAREPLAKQHPGLATAYAAAAIRQAGQQGAGDNKTVDGLVHGVETKGYGRGCRDSLRWSLQNVRVQVPIPSRLVNMSVTGMAVESHRGLPVGGSWIFRVGTDALAYDIPGRVCWCHLERTVKVDGEVQPVYRIGVVFDEKLSGKAFDFFSPAALETGTATAAAV